MRVPGELIPIVLFICIAATLIGVPIARAWARRLENGPGVPQTPRDVTDRLERIEQAVEAVAIEVERVAEAQRFAAKLMAEQQQRTLPKRDETNR